LVRDQDCPKSRSRTKVRSYGELKLG